MLWRLFFLSSCSTLKLLINETEGLTPENWCTYLLDRRGPNISQKDYPRSRSNPIAYSLDLKFDQNNSNCSVGKNMSTDRSIHIFSIY